MGGGAATVKSGKVGGGVICNKTDVREVPEGSLPKRMEDGLKLSSLLGFHPCGSTSAGSKRVTLKTGNTVLRGRDGGGITEKQWHTDGWRKWIAVEGAKCIETGEKK